MDILLSPQTNGADKRKFHNKLQVLNNNPKPFKDAYVVTFKRNEQSAEDYNTKHNHLVLCLPDIFPLAHKLDDSNQETSVLREIITAQKPVMNVYLYQQQSGSLTSLYIRQRLHIKQSIANRQDFTTIRTHRSKISYIVYALLFT